MIKKKKNNNLTIAYIRDELRNNRYEGDPVEALWFMLSEYDKLNKMSRRTRLTTREFEVVRKVA